MATFNDHIQQANSNLKFLENANLRIGDSFDWKVTICFYSALHIINAHLSKFGLSYLKHTGVKDAINPYNSVPISAVSEDCYVAYVSLQNLSRRSRYLIDVSNQSSPKPSFTYDRHYSKALRNLDKVMCFFKEKYGIEFEKTKVMSIEIQFNELKNFEKFTS